MSESERTPGYRNRSQVPPMASRASRIVYVRAGHSVCSRYAAPIPDRPAPTMRTSAWGVTQPSSSPAAEGQDERDERAERGARAAALAAVLRAAVRVAAVLPGTGRSGAGSAVAVRRARPRGALAAAAVLTGAGGEPEVTGTGLRSATG